MSASSRRRSSESVKSPTSPSSPNIPRPRPSNPRNASSFHRPSITRTAQPRRDSAASIASSIGGTLDTAPADTQTNDFAHNAISTLLSPPIVRTGLIPHTSLPQSSAHRPPTARDIAPVTLTSIPHVEPSAFDNYLSQVGPLFESFSRAKAASAEAADTLTSRIRAAENHDEFSDAFGKHASRHATSSPVRTRRPSVFDAPPTPSTPRSQRSRRAIQGPTPLSTIPQVYFDENFHLENPRTFDVVSEFSEIIPPERPASSEGRPATNGSATAPKHPRKALHTNAILQEKLSWYMDTVEVHLISSIAAASASFFAALGSLKDLQAEAGESIDNIKSVRFALQTMDKEMALGGLELAGMRRKRENLRRLSRAVNQLCEVVEEAKKCEELVDEGNVEAATARIDGLEDLIAGRDTTSDAKEAKASERIDLRKLKALHGISDGIEQLRSRIGRGFEERFKEALLDDMREHVKSVPRRETLQRFAQATFRGRSDHRRHQSIAPTYLNTSDHLRSTLLATLAGLSRAGQTSHAASSYRDAIMREMKSMIRQQLPSSSDDDTESTTSVSTRGGRRLTQQEKSAILARNLRALDAEAMEDLLTNVYTTVGEALRRLGIQTKILLDVTVTIDTTAAEQNESSENPRIQVQSPNQSGGNVREQVTEALDLSSLLGQAVDIVQGQITKVLKVRREENAHLPIEQFLRYFMLNRLFADECEAVSSRSGDALKDVVNSQVKDFVAILADTEKARISNALDADRWDVKDLDEYSSNLLSQILSSMTATPKSWTSYTLLWQGEAAAFTETPNGIPNGDTKSSTPRSAHIDDHRFFLTSSTAALLPGISHFTHLIAAIPAIASDASSHLLAYLKLFNSRACQLILGAGATKSAGLKNINSKHLALASQACSFVVTLLPYLREFVRRHLPTGAAAQPVLAEFDKVKRLFYDHQASIHEKLVDIMASRSAAHVAQFKKLSFDDLAAEGNTGPSKCVEDLCKETGTLHRVLSRHVGEGDLGLIMRPVFREYAEEWRKAVGEVKAGTEAGRARLMKDVETIEARLGKLEGGEELAKTLLEAVKGKKDATEANGGGTMFDADEEAEEEEEEEKATSVDAENAQSNKDSEKNDDIKKQEDKGGGGAAKGHQRTSTVEILGNGKK